MRDFLVKIIVFFIYAAIFYIIACNFVLFIEISIFYLIDFFLEKKKDTSDDTSSGSDPLQEKTIELKKKRRELINKSTNPKIIALRLQLEKSEADLYLSELELKAAFSQEKFLKQYLKLKMEYESYPLKYRNLVEEELADYLGESVKKKPLRSFLQLFINYLKERKD